MSALLQSPDLYRSLRRASEPGAILALARASLAATHVASGLAALTGVALRLTGINGVEITLDRHKGESEVFQWHNSRAAALQESATAIVGGNGPRWGHLRIHFEPRVQSVESTLRLARFFGQQTALMIDRLDLLARNEAHQHAGFRLRNRLEPAKRSAAQRV